ncbi:MAG: hypothetical protein KJ049_05140 [Gammaproteobacteria bacterium]|nr:hypothetical protein [Gammaproteobacteria bacterium]
MSLAARNMFLTAAALLYTGLVQAGDATSPLLDPARPGWSEIRMTAAKLFLTADAHLALRTLPDSAVRKTLLPIPGMQAIEPGTEVLELVYEAGGLGRKSRLTLLMDPVSGAALQGTHHDLEGKHRYRVWRYGETGAYQRTRWPLDRGEESLPPARWSKTSEGPRIYPVDPAGRPVLESTGLLYAIAAAPLDRPGDQVELLVFRRRDTRIVHVEVLAPRTVNVNYAELWPGGAVQRRGEITPLRLAVRGLPVANPATDKGSDDEFELLGLRGNIELLLDAETRTPLLLSGSAPVLGRVTLRLSEVRLN